MSKPETAIKNLITSHLRRGLFGIDVYGRHEIPAHDGQTTHVCVIEIKCPSRFERYGQVVVYHPWLGKWIATLLSSCHAGKPVLALTADEIAASIAVRRSADFLYTVYPVPMPEHTVVQWDPYNASDVGQ